MAAIQTRGGAYRYVVLALLLTTYLLNYLDRQLVSILAEPIKTSLGLSDTQLGLVSGVMFALFYTAFGVPVAWLADRMNRVTIISIACGLWSVFTGLCGVAGSFTHLALARIGVGVGEAGGAPPSYALLSDYFPPQRRGFAMGVFSLGIPLGILLGGVYGAWATAHFGWRGAFIGLALPGIALAILLPLCVREPERGALDAPPEVKTAKASLATTIMAFVKSPPLMLATLGCSFSAIGGYSLQTWSPAFLMRVQHATLDEVGGFYSPAIGVAIAIGIFGSGWLADRFDRHGLKAYPLVPALAYAVALPLFLYALSATNWRASVLALIVPQGLTFMHLVPALAVVQNIARPEQRATSSALFLFVLNLLAIGAGPLYVGAVSDWLKASYGVESLRYALYALAPFFGLGIGCNVAASVMLARRAKSA
jgi:predicted MFS family arabinose efflux permease